MGELTASRKSFNNIFFWLVVEMHTLCNVIYNYIFILNIRKRILNVYVIFWDFFFHFRNLIKAQEPSLLDEKIMPRFFFLNYLLSVHIYSFHLHFQHTCIILDMTCAVQLILLSFFCPILWWCKFSSTYYLYKYL
jgi:hypothetical protein